MFCIPDKHEPFFKILVSFAVCWVGTVLTLRLADVKQVVNLRIFNSRLFGKLSPCNNFVHIRGTQIPGV